MAKIADATITHFADKNHWTFCLVERDAPVGHGDGVYYSQQHEAMDAADRCAKDRGLVIEDQMKHREFLA